MNPRKAMLLLAVLFTAYVPLALAQGTYTQIDVPGSNGTFCFGFNTKEDITGTYADASIHWHGFLLRSGAYTFIDYPGAQDTILYGLNDLDQVVGITESIGFLYDSGTHTFTTISYPGAGLTQPISINNAGTIVGTFEKNQFARQRGFELVGSTYTRIKPLNAQRAGAYGISGAGKVVGFATVADDQGILLFSNGKYRHLTIPNAASAIAYGINKAGNALVGYYAPSPDIIAGFVYQNMTLQELQFPGSTSTTAFSVNNAGEVAGYFNDSTGTHGFTWTPPADAEKKSGSE
jgi:uncharacterized membrane protein